jgi:hypothetical protein
MQVVCASCQVPVLTEDVNVVRVVAKCRACGAVFSFDDQLGAPPTAEAPRAPALVVPMPPGIVVQREGTPSDGIYRSAETRALVITRRWFTKDALFLLMVALVIDVTLVVWSGLFFTRGGPWIMVLFLLSLLFVGWLVSYEALCRLFNRSIIRVGGGLLTVRHGPIPAGKARDVPVEEVRQLYVEEIVGSKGAKSYNVQIVLTTGPTLTLVTELQSPLQARFLEQTVEDHLRLPDEPMPLEPMPRSSTG